jgi:anthranilate/para-aminobenzoate synthase component II
MKICYIDNYDSYSESIIDALYLQQVREVPVFRYGQLTDQLSNLLNTDGIVLGPGSGNPVEIHASHLFSISQFINSQKPILGICLGFQIICTHFHLPIVRLERPHHGEIHSGYTYYNSFGCLPTEKPQEEVRVGYNSNGEVCELYHATQPIFAVQYHPESICSENGLDLFAQFIAHAKPCN